MRSLPIVAAVFIVIAVLAGCGGQPPAQVERASPSTSSPPRPPSLVPSPPATTSGPLVIVETRGGECPEGACGSVVQVEADGRLRQVVPTDTVLAQIPPDLLEALQVEIDQANFALIESEPFTDTCPVAYDGQEVIYTFSVRQGAAERIASCEVAIDENHPLFRAVSAVLALAQR